MIWYRRVLIELDACDAEALARSLKASAGLGAELQAMLPPSSGIAQQQAQVERILHTVETALAGSQATARECLPAPGGAS
jgi:hypothetical protein